MSLEIVFPRHWIKNFDENNSRRGLRVGLDLIGEVRVRAHLWELRYKKVIAKLDNLGVHPLGVGLGDMVLQKTKVSNPIRSWGKSTLN